MGEPGRTQKPARPASRNPPEAFAKFLVEDMPKGKVLVDAAGIRLDQ